MVDRANHLDTNAKDLPDAKCGYSGYFIVAFVDLLRHGRQNAEIKRNQIRLKFLSGRSPR